MKFHEKNCMSLNSEKVESELTVHVHSTAQTRKMKTKYVSDESACHQMHLFVHRDLRIIGLAPN